MTNETDGDKYAWIDASPYYVRCTDPNCRMLKISMPPERHYHYVGAIDDE